MDEEASPPPTEVVVKDEAFEAAAEPPAAPEAPCREVRFLSDDKLSVPEVCHLAVPPCLHQLMELSFLDGQGSRT